MGDSTLLPNTWSADAAAFNIIRIWYYRHAGEGEKLLACSCSELP